MVRRKQLIRKIKSSFECQRCGECCKQPGFVFLTAKDIRGIARRLGLGERDFLRGYTFQEDGQTVLNMRKDGSCIFFEENGCSIHDVKPVQCVEFPMKWREEESFDYCEGIKKLKNQMEEAIQSKKSVEQGVSDGEETERKRKER